MADQDFERPRMARQMRCRAQRPPEPAWPTATRMQLQPRSQRRATKRSSRLPRRVRSTEPAGAGRSYSHQRSYERVRPLPHAGEARNTTTSPNRNDFVVQGPHEAWHGQPITVDDQPANEIPGKHVEVRADVLQPFLFFHEGRRGGRPHCRFAAWAYNAMNANVHPADRCLGGRAKRPLVRVVETACRAVVRPLEPFDEF